MKIVRENNMKTIGVSQKAIVFNKEGKFLALRRSKTAPYGSYAWDLPGGDLQFGEDAQKGILREIKEETGLTVKNLIPFDVESHIEQNGIFWITVAYKCGCPQRKVKLSCEHDKFRWLAAKEFLKLDSSKKLRRFVEKLI